MRISCPNIAVPDYAAAPNRPSIHRSPHPLSGAVEGAARMPNLPNPGGFIPPHVTGAVLCELRAESACPPRSVPQSRWNVHCAQTQGASTR